MPRRRRTSFSRGSSASGKGDSDGGCAGRTRQAAKFEASSPSERILSMTCASDIYPCPEHICSQSAPVYAVRLAASTVCTRSVRQRQASSSVRAPPSGASLQHRSLPLNEEQGPSPTSRPTSVLAEEKVVLPGVHLQAAAPDGSVGCGTASAAAVGRNGPSSHVRPYRRCYRRGGVCPRGRAERSEAPR